MIKETPRIFSQGLVTLVNSPTAFDQSHYQSDGDFVCRIDTLLGYPGGTASNPDEPEFVIKPTNAPVWSRVPVPLSLLFNLYNFPFSNPGKTTGASCWYLEHPTYLGVRDGFDIQAAWGSALTPALIYGLSMVGAKLLRVTEVPKPFFSPRILYTQAPNNTVGNGEAGTIANNASRTLDLEGLRNWGDRKMHLHRLAFQYVASDASDPLAADAFRVRIASSKYGNWIAKNQRVSLDALQDGLTASILLGDVILDEDEALIVEVLNNGTGKSIQAKCAAIGSVEVG